MNYTNKRKAPYYNFWKVYFGEDEAKGDNKLPQYFLRIPEFDDIKSGKYRYIIGRKGTGKTAIIEQLIHEIEPKYNCFYRSMSLKNFPIQIVRNLKDKTLGGKAQFVPIWSFLILMELCKLIIEDQSNEPHEAVFELSLFIKTNFPNSLGFTETLRTLESSENKVSILEKWLNISSTNKVENETMVSVHYQKAFEIILRLLKNLKVKSTYYIFFDELDEGYTSGDPKLNLLLLALIRSTENCFIELKNYFSFIPILALRSDIFNNLTDNDLNKLDDYIIHLKWTTESKSPYSLYQLVNYRIAASLPIKKNEIFNAWELATFNQDKYLPPNIKSLWDYMYNRTFERPRDIVKFLKCCSKLNQKGKLNFKAVQLAENEYSDWFYREFRDEVQSHLPVWQESTQAIMKLGRGVFQMEELKKEFEKDITLMNYMKNQNVNHEYIMEKLFDFGLIGTLSESNKWFFRYKDYNLPFLTNQKIILHFGFARKFRIRPW
ncbi:P-loop ATPase, Sll1717 family [Draconibacterium mangrovi]|uniref:P-loop ATPase, Sll1717 family n=1 Tax=Draconibacterium mangrovi TaxID=2697469 RepID=UPI0013D87F4C|nr:hypothetical protein [Draconibacterium mangrovi]